MDTTFVLLSFALSQASFSNYSDVQNSLAWQAKGEGLIVHSQVLETAFRSVYNGLWSGKERSLADETRVETQLVVKPLFWEVEVQTSFTLDFIPTYAMSIIGLYDEPTSWLSVWFGAALKETYNGQWMQEIGTDSGMQGVVKINGAIRMKAEFEIFQPLSGASNERTWRDIDVRADFSLIGEISKHLNASVEASLVYDHDVSPKRRLKQLVMVGLSYKIGG